MWSKPSWHYTAWHAWPNSILSLRPCLLYYLTSTSLSLSHGGESENECWKSEGNESVLLSLFQSLKIIDEYPTSQTIKRKTSFHVQLSIIMILTLTIIFSQSGNKISTQNEFPVKPSRGCWVLTETKPVLVFMERLSALEELIAAELTIGVFLRRVRVRRRLPGQVIYNRKLTQKERERGWTINFLGSFVVQQTLPSFLNKIRPISVCYCKTASLLNI